MNTPVTQSIQVLVLSNQILYSEALKNLLQSADSHLQIEAFSVKNPDIHSIMNSLLPDLILLDANGMGKNIWDFLHSTHTKMPKTGIIMLANSNESIYLDYASKNGARGYVLKTSPKELLMAAIKIVLKGGQFFDPGKEIQPNGASKNRLQGQYNLSSREMEIIQLIKDGLSTKDVASHLGLSFHTIETHRKNIYNKLGIRKVTDLLRLYNEFSN